MKKLLTVLFLSTLLASSPAVSGLLANVINGKCDSQFRSCMNTALTKSAAFSVAGGGVGSLIPILGTAIGAVAAGSIATIKTVRSCIKLHCPNDEKSTIDKLAE